MNLNEKFKSYPQAMGLFMVANGVLSSIANLDDDSLRRMLESIESILNEINADQNAVEKILFENGKPSLIESNNGAMLTLYFLANQFKLRGSNDHEAKNLLNAINTSENFLNALDQFRKFKADTNNTFEILKYGDFFNSVSAATKS